MVRIHSAYDAKYPKLVDLVENGIGRLVDDSAVLNAFVNHSNLDRAEAEKTLKERTNPWVEPDIDGSPSTRGSVSPTTLRVASDIALALEASPDDARIQKLVQATILRGIVLWSRQQYGSVDTAGHGDEFESAAFGGLVTRDEAGMADGEHGLPGGGGIGGEHDMSGQDGMPGEDGMDGEHGMPGEGNLPGERNGGGEAGNGEEGPGSGNGRVTLPSVDGPEIHVSESDLDALARVSQSEVGHFGRYGAAQLSGGLEAVVDTIFNRVAHPNSFFPDTIQGVINKRAQFSAVRNRDWRTLPKARRQIWQIVETHIQERASGKASAIRGATHFLNPYLSSASALRGWGNHVKANATAIYGKDSRRDVHYHGFAPNVSPAPSHIIGFRGKSFAFDGRGTPLQMVAETRLGQPSHGFLLPGRPSMQLDPSGKIGIGSEGLEIEYRGVDTSPYGRSASRNQRPFMGIVIHHTAPRHDTDWYIQYQIDGDRARGGHFGYHYYISPGGNIYQGAPFTKRTNNISPNAIVRRSFGRQLQNTNVIGVTCVGAGTPDGFAPTENQVESTKTLVFALADLFELSFENVVGHGEIQMNRMFSEGRSLAETIRSW